MAETRARRRIREAVESRGYKLATLRWEPWYNAGEKEGIGGGWYGTTDRPYEERSFPGDDIMGLSVDETIAWIDEFVGPPEPCPCAADHYPLNPLVGDPQTGRHVESCRWHLRYRLRWWAS